MENSFKAISLNSDLTTNDKIFIILRTCLKELVYVRQYYDKCIYDEDHWIFGNIDDMLKDDDTVNLHEVKISLSKIFLNVRGTKKKNNKFDLSS